LASAAIPRHESTKGSIMSEQIQSAVDPTQAPNFPKSADQIETAGQGAEQKAE
jgi:hypothetical protein